MVFFWFRRDLRLHDNCALYHALKSGQEVLPVFIFDSNILEKLPNAHDQRVDLLHQVLGGLKQELENMGSSLLVVNGQPLEVWQQLIASHSPTGLYFNHDYEPYAQSRDEAITHLFALNQKRVFSFKDQVIFEKSEVVKDDGLPYTVFTPYFNKWQKALTSEHYTAYDNALWFRHFKKTKPLPLLSLSQLGFEKTKFTYEPPSLDQLNVANYSALRDYPAKAGTSKMSVNLRFGMVSIRGLVLIAIQNNHHKYLAELVWREFYQMILFHFPKVDKAFKPQYDLVVWRNNIDEFKLWCAGKTGFPMVDAGMRELNATGYMHNRVRMITASFLIKDLLIDWRWGEQYFAEKLLDFDLAANNGGWQWAASSGCDAAPYFRIFNPEEQRKKFDPDFEYIRLWIPEINDVFAYPKPIVDHKTARERTLLAYKKALEN